MNGGHHMWALNMHIANLIALNHATNINIHAPSYAWFKGKASPIICTTNISLHGHPPLAVNEAKFLHDQPILYPCWSPPQLSLSHPFLASCITLSSGSPCLDTLAEFHRSSSLPGGSLLPLPRFLTLPAEIGWHIWEWGLTAKWVKHHELYETATNHNSIHSIREGTIDVNNFKRWMVRLM